MKYEDSARRRRSKLLLIVGFLALTFAILRAHFDPATGYELSIYGATAPTVWVGVAVALVAAAAVTALRPRGWLVPTALGLAIMATALVVFLPTVRGYFGYGQADALTHMGWARGIISGEMEAMEIFYPGGHSAVGLIHSLTGMTVPHAMMLLTQLLALGYLVFVPLTIRTLVDDRAGTAIAVFAACMFMPVTQISTSLDFHPYSMTTLFFPVVLFLMFEYLSRHSRGLANGVTATGLLVFLGSVASILFHGQVALNVLILFATIALVQRYYRWLPGGSLFADARSMAVPTALFGAFYVLWASRYQIVYTMSDKVYTAVADWASGGGGGGEVVKNTGNSASQIGVSIVELFMKLFFVKTVFVALSAILVLVALAGRLDDGSEERNEAITYFAYGGLVLGPFFLAHFVGNISKYFFRHVGFAMVIATILGAVMLHSFYRAVAAGKYERTIRAVAVIAVIGGLLLSLLVVFPSPYVYLPTSDVPESMHDGYNTSFQYNDSDARWVGLRGGPHQRYQDALRGPVIFSWGADLTSANFTQDELTRQVPNPYYLTISQYDYEREVYAYAGGTFSEEALNSVTDEDGVSKSITNSGLTVYYVDSSQPPDAGGSSNGSDGGAQQTEGPPASTATPEPTATSTPIPEVTPTSTATPEPTATPTPEPTTTPQPTATPEPTATPQPTATPTPEPTTAPTTSGGNDSGGNSTDDGGLFALDVRAPSPPREQA